MMKFLLLGVFVWAMWTYYKGKAAAMARPAIGQAEARAILGVPADADEETIRAAHRRLLAGVHPDRGGSTELAGRVNAARDVLLTRR